MFQIQQKPGRGSVKNTESEDGNLKSDINHSEMLAEQHKMFSRSLNSGKEHNHPVQRMVKEEDENKPIQGKSDQGKGNISGKEQSVATSTTSMDEGVKGKMENSFATSFQDVTIHKNDESASQLGALAYTQGNNVHFAPGQYNPGTQEGKELLGHELTHVIQQRQGRVKPTKQGKGMPVNDNPSLENEADTFGKLAAKGKSITETTQPAQSGNQVQLQEDIRGEMGLTNGTVTRSSGGVTVDGETSDGKPVRDVSYSSEADYQQSEGRIQELQQTASTHAFFEFVAHFLAYQEPGYEPPQDIRTIIEGAGYLFVEIVRADMGFQYVYLSGEPSGKNDILGVRGTNPGLRPSDMATIYADVDPTAVGMQQFNFNRELINGLMNNGPLDVTGHSLGGAVAQIITAYYASDVGSLYTFQAPGIDDSQVEMFKNTPAEDRPEVFHHVAVGDMVDKAGEMNLPGNVYVHDFGLFYIKTQDLLSEAGQTMSNVGGDISGVISEAGSVAETIVKGGLEQLIPIYGLFQIRGRISEIMQDVEDMKEHIGDAKQEIADLIELIGNVAGAVGEAHLSYLFSSENFAGNREGTGLTDDFYTGSNGSSGPGRESSGQSSVVTAHGSYPFQDERASAETVRDIVGGITYSIVNPLQLLAIRETIEFIAATLNLIERIANQIVELLEEWLTSAWDAITSFPGRIMDLGVELMQALEDLILYRSRIPYF